MRCRCSCRYVRSGVMRSTPGSSDSGNVTPASTTTSVSPNESAIRFMPNSRSPPRATTSSVGPEGSTGVSRLFMHQATEIDQRAVRHASHGGSLTGEGPHTQRTRPNQTHQCRLHTCVRAAGDSRRTVSSTREASRSNGDRSAHPIRPLGTPEDEGGMILLLRRQTRRCDFQQAADGKTGATIARFESGRSL